MLAVAELAPQVGLRIACQAFALNRGFVYRDRAGPRLTSPERASRRGRSAAGAVVRYLRLRRSRRVPPNLKFASGRVTQLEYVYAVVPGLRVAS